VCEVVLKVMIPFHPLPQGLGCEWNQPGLFPTPGSLGGGLRWTYGSGLRAPGEGGAVRCSVADDAVFRWNLLLKGLVLES
jgi:hypothetical protein